MLQIDKEKKIRSSDLKSFIDQFENNKQFTVENIEGLISDTDETTALRILARFTETLSEIKNTFDKALISNEFSEVWMYCHKVSSSAELLGFIDFTEKAKQLGIEVKNPLLDVEQKQKNVKTFSEDAEN
jgi:HPt (histidine-containing phosphotransfer) domain-containing protein